MKKNNIKINNRGITLAEVLVAVALLGILAIPVFMGISHGAADELNYDKVAAANKVLESFKNEMKNLSYEYAVELADRGSFNGLDTAPNTFNELLKAQEKFRDLKFQGKAERDTSTGAEAIKFTVWITWTKQGGSQSRETIFFIKTK